MAETSLQKLFICEKAFFSEDKKLNIIGIFDQLNGPEISEKTPLVYPFFIVGVLEGESNKDVKLKLETVSPTKGVTAKNTRELAVHLNENGKLNFIINTQAIFVSEGKHRFKLSTEGKQLGEASITVIVLAGGGQSATRGKLSN